MNRFFKFSLCGLGAVVLFFCLFLLYFTLGDYKPQPRELLFNADKCDTLDVTKPISVLSWNIGYAGLDKDMDFFYDGGEMVRPSNAQYKKNIDAIGRYLESKNNTDFFLIQEIDEDAKRSYGQNQVEHFSNLLEGYHSYFALNYNVRFVPLPVTEPMGRVRSGLAAFSKFVPSVAERYAFPFNFDWPERVFMLDRCFLMMRFPTSDNRELVLIDTHNSAFDDGGKIRKAELGYFCDFLQKEYSKGNYVIVGGDFNQCPNGIDEQALGSSFDKSEFHVIPDSLLYGWNYVFDKSKPTNRRADMPYVKGKTKVTLIDFFITSPNVSAVSVCTDNLEFENSDHNPVNAIFKFEE